MSTTPIRKGNLHFVPQGNGFTCHELAGIPAQFESMWDLAEINGIIADRNEFMRTHVEKAYATKEEHDAVPEAERLRLGAEIFSEVLATIDVSTLSPFQKFIFWLGDWWYYHPIIRSKCRGVGFNAAWGKTQELLAKYVVPTLPDQVRETVAGMKVCNCTVGFGHFALLFHSDNQIRRIVTDTQLFELRDAYGYNYLNIDQHGNPIVRCQTSRAGERAFFDGHRLMSHDSFQTCAPKAVIFDAGYKINSTGVTIINGGLYPLIDADDAVAKTTGAFWGMCNFNTDQQVASFQMSEESAARLQVAGNTITLDGKTIKPMGIFQPSQVTLLDSGFSLYEWSTFNETHAVQYDHIMVIDDNGEWIGQVQAALSAEVSNLKCLQTGDGNDALAQILQENPQVVILDMHLTPEERFEGLYIANQLFARKFGGVIMIASGYPEEKLQAMATLIKGKVEIPGKNVEQVLKCLSKPARRK